MSDLRLISSTMSWTDFIPMMARDIVRLAVGAEGLSKWLESHGGTRNAPSRATRAYAEALLGDTDEADVLNAIMIIEIDRVCLRGI